MMLQNYYHHITRSLFAMMSVFLLIGCASVTHSGVSILDDEIAIVTEGSSKKEVLQAIGSPSFTSFEEEITWYYVNTVWHRRLFFPYRLHQRTMITLQFDDNDKVLIKTTDDITAQNRIKPDKRITPTLGVKTGVFSEIFGNIGNVHQ